GTLSTSRTWTQSSFRRRDEREAPCPPAPRQANFLAFVEKAAGFSDRYRVSEARARRLEIPSVAKGPRSLVPKKGLEPPHPCGYMDLNHARLPIPPLRLVTLRTSHSQ